MTIDALVTLPGVGRKTANVITSVIDQPSNEVSASAVADGEGVGRLLQEVETKTVTVLN